MKNKKASQEVILYQAPSGAIEFRGDIKKETIWATQKQIAEAFGVTPQNITLHLKNIFSSGELDEKATCKESLQVQIEGKREIKRTVKEYNLDVIISVGYRIDSVVGTHFRKWATKTIKQHMVNGYTINKKLIQENHTLFERALTDIQKLSHGALTSSDTVELIVLSTPPRGFIFVGSTQK